jgi:hypothetical protein
MTAVKVPRAKPAVTPSSARTPPGCTFVTPASSTTFRGGAPFESRT